jgi:hypothetical protein
MMQSAITWLLILLLAGSVLSLLLMGLGQVRRAGRLARKAHEHRLNFAKNDPFDIPLRYRNLALVSSGHSGHAHNVTYGRLESWPVRGCDFRYEAAHGMRRLTRHYSLAVLESDLDLPALLMWHEQDLEAAPVCLRQSTLQEGAWVCVGDAGLARQLARAFEASAPSCRVGAQVLGPVVAVFCPVARRSDDYLPLVEALRAVLRCPLPAPQPQASAAEKPG